MVARPADEQDHQLLKLSVVLENAPVILYGLDTAARFTFSEGNGLAAAGLRAGQVTGTSAFDLYREHPSALTAISGALAGEHTIFEAHFGGADFVSRLTPVVDDDGGVREVVGVSLDIGEQVRAERLLDERDEQLRQSQRLEAVGQLAGGIAHDFNNLLTAIIGYSEMILRAGEGEMSSVREDAEQIKRAADHAAGLTRQILAFSRRQTLRPVVASLNDLLAETEPLLRRVLGEDVDLDLVLDPGLGLIAVDPGQFSQVVMNLCINARQAMPDGGLLRVRTSNAELDEMFCLAHPDATPGAHVVMTVSDTGVGMDKDVMPHVFEPFFTTKDPGEGTGLGLSTVYGIVRQSGGSIGVESRPGEGATFSLFFPRVGRSTEKLPVLVPPVALTDVSRAILVVEDEAAVRMLVDRVLSGEGCLVFSTGSAAEALAFLEDEGRPIDLLLTDIRLPGALQGDALAEKALALRPDLPVLLMSGYPHDAAARGQGVGAGIAFLQKPFTPAGLVAKVREVLRRHPE